MTHMLKKPPQFSIRRSLACFDTSAHGQGSSQCHWYHRVAGIGRLYRFVYDSVCVESWPDRGFLHPHRLSSRLLHSDDDCCGRRVGIGRTRQQPRHQFRDCAECQLGLHQLQQHQRGIGTACGCKPECRCRHHQPVDPLQLCHRGVDQQGRGGRVVSCGHFRRRVGWWNRRKYVRPGQRSTRPGPGKPANMPSSLRRRTMGHLLPARGTTWTSSSRRGPSCRR